MCPLESRTWQDEWVPLYVEFMLSTGDGNWSAERIRAERSIPDHVDGYFKDQIAALVAKGWERQAAETFTLLLGLRLPLANAMKANSDRYAASTYALCDAFVQEKLRMRRVVAPPLYANVESGFVNSR